MVHRVTVLPLAAGAGVALVASAITGCIMYPGGSFRDAGRPFVGTRYVSSCLDLAVTPTEDNRAPGRIVAYYFGNRCHHDVDVDLASVRVIGRFDDGDRPLTAYDPKHELRALPIAALWQGDERIAYVAADGRVPATICAEVGHIDRAGPNTDHWMCFALAVTDGAP